MVIENLMFTDFTFQFRGVFFRANDDGKLFFHPLDYGDETAVLRQQGSIQHQRIDSVFLKGQKHILEIAGFEQFITPIRCKIFQCFGGVSCLFRYEDGFVCAHCVLAVLLLEAAD